MAGKKTFCCMMMTAALCILAGCGGRDDFDQSRAEGSENLIQENKPGEADSENLEQEDKLEGAGTENPEQEDKPEGTGAENPEQEDKPEGTGAENPRQEEEGTDIVKQPAGSLIIKQVLNYITGSSLEQADYAEELGTTAAGTVMTNIPAVLNAHSGLSHEYIYDDITSKSYWSDRICISIDLGRPAVLDINTKGIEDWPYETSGHFVNVSGYRKDVLELKEIRITDPFKEGLGNRWYPVDTLYQANENHFRQAFIW